MDKTNFDVVKEKDEELNLGAHKWYGKEDRTDEAEMHDKGKGEPILIRLFEFKFPATLEHLPTKEEILTPEYIKHLRTQLWADGLRLVIDPQVAIDKAGCKIFAPCQATTGNNFLDTPKTIQEWTN